MLYLLQEIANSQIINLIYLYLLRCFKLNNKRNPTTAPLQKRTKESITIFISGYFCRKDIKEYSISDCFHLACLLSSATLYFTLFFTKYRLYRHIDYRLSRQWFNRHWEELLHAILHDETYLNSMKYIMSPWTTSNLRPHKNPHSLRNIHTQNSI